MKKRLVVIISLLLCISGIFCILEESTQATPITWECLISVNETGGKIDTVWFGEAPDANDGPPADSYDVVKPPMPMTPFVRTWFNDNLIDPYDVLWKDYRHYPATEKVWNLSVWWNDDIDTSITLSWNTSQINMSEYSSVLLRTSSGTTLVNMSLTSSYSYFCQKNSTPQLFQIFCTTNVSPNGTTPPGPPGGGSTPENSPPVANASASETRGIIESAVLFDGSLSTDGDGDITSWVWDFGDGSDGEGERISHVYETTGEYTVTLTVTDDDGATDTDTITVTIVSANNPPSSPVFEGIIRGEKNTIYTFTVRSTDADNDSLQYQIDWGDSSGNTSGFLPNGTIYVCTHAWSSPGKFLIIATVSDVINVSEQTPWTVFIDVHFIGTLGFLLDTDDDEVFDAFYVNATSMVTTVTMLTNGSYVLTVDGEAPAEYLYNPGTGALSLWEPEEPGEIGTNTILIVVVSSMVVILVLLCVVYLVNKKQRK